MLASKVGLASFLDSLVLVQRREIDFDRFLGESCSSISIQPQESNWCVAFNIDNLFLIVGNRLVVVVHTFYVGD